MNRTLILSVAFAALVGAGVAVAQPEPPHHPGMRHAFPGGDMDTNHDGWLSRDEAAAAADRIFADAATRAASADVHDADRQLRGGRSERRRGPLTRGIPRSAPALLRRQRRQWRPPHPLRAAAGATGRPRAAPAPGATAAAAPPLS